jgi:monoamine oxidase
MNYDMIIVGAGISGLRVGLETLRKHKKTRICILEQYGAVGGRMWTDPKGWEIGAGRLATTHSKVLSLVRHYGLHTIPITNDNYTVTDAGLVLNPFWDLVATWIQPLLRLGPETLGLHTLDTLLTKLHGAEKTRSFASLFPYWSELHTLRADLAIQSFQTEFGSKADFLVCAEGLQAIAKKMAADFAHLGGTFRFKTTVTEVRHGTVTLQDKTSLTAPRIVLALHADALRSFRALRIPALRHLKMEPLVRMYAVFPTPFWYKDLPKIVTPGPLRYIIPVKNALMISYTDGDDAAYWIKKPKGAAQKEVLATLRALLPTIDIPDPTEFHIYPWTSGTTYWLPGRYDPAQMIRDSLQIQGGLYACGESLSLKQAWIEGALDSADELLRIL